MSRYASLLLLLSTIGYLDYLTGYEVSFAIFYLLPVLGAAWLIGRRAGLAFAFLAAGTWMLADHADGHIYSHRIFFVWNGINRLAMGVGMALLAGALRKRVDHQKALIMDLRRALLASSELSAQIPYCPICGDLRTDDGYEKELREFLSMHAEPKSLGRACLACAERRAEYFRMDSQPSASAAHSGAAEISPA